MHCPGCHAPCATTKGLKASQRPTPGSRPSLTVPEDSLQTSAARRPAPAMQHGLARRAAPCRRKWQAVGPIIAQALPGWQAAGTMTAQALPGWQTAGPTSGGREAGSWRAGGTTSAGRGPSSWRAAGPAVRAQASASSMGLGDRSLPRVLILHTGGTLGMLGSSSDSDSSDEAAPSSSKGSGGLRPSTMLANVLSVVPELLQLSDIDLQVVFNKDSSRVGPPEWIQVARILHDNRNMYDAFLIIHGTDTMAYTASALSLMLQGFDKPVVMTGSQLPLAAPRTDARQNLLDAIQCATAAHWPPHVSLREVAICFGGRLMRGNRTRKVHSMLYQAFDSPGYPYLAQLGIDVAWNERVLLYPETHYTPRFALDPRVLRIPVVPGLDPRLAYGDLVGRGVRGAVLEVFGVGNLPDLPEMGWVPWLESQMAAGLQVIPISQCAAGPLHSGMYEAGNALNSLITSGHTVAATAVGPALRPAGAGGGMTPECAVVKLMLALANPDVLVGESLAGEL